ncbi:MAG TPA: hypothetical protein VGM39_05705, partial [Kofleriaceae bacterium]
AGISTIDMLHSSGLADDTWREYGHNFLRGWIWPSEPPTVFYDSRALGGGFVMLVAIALVPVFVRHATRIEKWLAGSCVLVALAAHDFWYPRWCYALVAAIAIVIGRGLLELSRTPRHRWRFWCVLVVLGLHLLRPEYELVRVDPGPRIDVAASPWFIDSAEVLEMFPASGTHFAIIEHTHKGMLLPIYGRDLSNTVTATIKQADLDRRCEALRPLLDADPSLLVIDDLDLTRACRRTCAFTDRHGRCRAWQIKLRPHHRR